MRALRALYSSAEEWELLFPSTRSGQVNFSLDTLGQPLSSATEKRVAAALKGLIAAELNSKPTTLDADIALLKSIVSNAQSSSIITNRSSGSSTTVGSGMFEDATISAIAFRIEKKRLLDEVMSMA